MVVGRVVNMKKPAVAAALVLAAVSVAVPAHADEDGDVGGGGRTSVGDCLQELVDLPMFGEGSGNYQRNCSSGNVVAHLDQSGAGR
ncbi:hypothetical protein [Streptomyces sp. NPDC093111]|uniref:hypothetical protein n=1 Tax=Streptomyces sp. NPDC093111 TaxID=3154978 RepID=UPI003437712D